MKKLTTLLPFCAAIILAACNSSTTNADGELLASNDDKKKESCAATCAAKGDKSGEFDFAMSSVCQAACGVKDWEEEDVVSIAEAKVGDITRCPISGAVYEVKANSPKLTHEGKEYHACCAGCAEKFKVDPERFHKNV